MNQRLALRSRESFSTKYAAYVVVTPTAYPRKAVFRGRQTYACRFIHCVLEEEIAGRDQVVRHRCHNRLCINPEHTAALFGSVPKLVLDADELVRFDTIDGEVPSPLSPPSGCYYHPRCPLATEGCRAEQPVMQPISDLRGVACHHHERQLSKLA